MNLLMHLSDVGMATMLDVLPIVSVLAFFQIAIIRKRPANLKRIVTGFLYVLLGLTLFLVGLREALSADWRDYGWVYAFAFAIGFATTIAEPALMAVAVKANQVSGGAISVWGLRITVALGVAVGVSLGTFRIVTGTPLHWYIIAGYAALVLQTWRAVRVAGGIVPLAYDSGGVTTSTVTVPLITALGLGLASTIPGRNPVIDGFGLIAFASLFPMISVLGYAELSAWKAKRRQRNTPDKNGSEQ
jgi:hypothetical protein